MHEDQIIKLKHGDVLYHEWTGEFAFRFRCGPVPRHAMWGLSLKHRHIRRSRAVGSFRHPRTRSSIITARAHIDEGIHVRRKSNVLLPDERFDRYAHSQRSWKRTRKTQYRQ